MVTAAAALLLLSRALAVPGSPFLENIDALVMPIGLVAARGRRTQAARRSGGPLAPCYLTCGSGAGLTPRVRRLGVDPAEQAAPLGLDLGQPAAAVEERGEADGAGTRDAGPDVPADIARRVLPDRHGGLGWRVGRQAADEEADRAVELVNAVDRLLGRVADVGERLVLERVADLGDAR
jgi:hypothetical protein